jgi:hypothetical protein
MSIVIYIATAINSSLFPLTKHPLFLRSRARPTSRRRLPGLVVGDPTVKNPILEPSAELYPVRIYLEGAKEMSPPAALFATTREAKDSRVKAEKTSIVV